jgi:hypothetical protein
LCVAKLCVVEYSCLQNVLFLTIWSAPVGQQVYTHMRQAQENRVLSLRQRFLPVAKGSPCPRLNGSRNTRGLPEKLKVLLLLLTRLNSE